MDRVNILRRHELHIRCLQASFADFEAGTSDKQVKHSTLHSQSPKSEKYSFEGLTVSLARGRVVSVIQK